MLTRTYSSLALTCEQKNARQVLSRLNRCLDDAKLGSGEQNGAASARTALQKFVEADRYRRSRSIERHVIPALRHRIPEAGSLLEELDTIAGTARVLHHAHESIAAGQDKDGVEMQTVLSAMEQYCRQLHDRLGKEESELIPLAFRSLTPEEWFAIAAKSLSEGPAQGRKAFT